MLLRALMVVLALLALALVAALVAVLRDPKAARRRIESLFRRPDKPRPLEPDHYYRPYWS